mgnify:CR=1 FL=1
MSEAVAYSAFCGLLSPLGHSLSDKMAYIFLDLVGRSICEYLAFSTITELWLQTALSASPATLHLQSSLVVRSLNRALGAVSVVMSVVLAVYMVLDEDDLVKIEQTELLFRLQILMESLAWGLGAGFVVMIIKITAERIQTSFATFPPNGGALERLALQSQALVPMGVICSCYIVRSFFLLCRLAGQTPLFIATTRFHPIWWVCFVWGPTLLVVLMALYSARRRDRMTMDSDQHTIPLLGNPIAPPAEAFAHFRQSFAEGMLSPFGSVAPSPVKESAATNNSDGNHAAAASPGGNHGEYNLV